MLLLLLEPFSKCGKAHGNDSPCQAGQVQRYHSAETEHFGRPGSVLVQREPAQLAGGLGAD